MLLSLPLLPHSGSNNDYPNSTFPNTINTSYNSSGNSSVLSNSGGLLHLNNSHDSSSIGNSPGSNTDHSGSFSAAGTPASSNNPHQQSSMTNLNTSSNGGFPSSVSPPPLHGEAMLPSNLQHHSNQRRGSRQGGSAQCPQCDKRFNNSSALAKHKLM